MPHRHGGSGSDQPEPNCCSGARVHVTGAGRAWDLLERPGGRPEGLEVGPPVSMNAGEAVLYRFSVPHIVPHDWAPCPVAALAQRRPTYLEVEPLYFE